MKSTEQTGVLANLFCEKTGLVNYINAMKSELEYEFSGSYTPISGDDDGDPYPSYGMKLYDEVIAIDKGEYDVCMDNEVLGSQRTLLNRLIQEKTLKFDITREDYSGQQWYFSIFVPLDFNDNQSESLRLEVQFKCSALSDEYEIVCYVDDSIDDEIIENLVTLYGLQLATI